MTRPPRILPALILLLTLTSTASAQAPTAAERVSTAADRTGVSLTVYQDDLTLVRETRQVRLAAGEGRLALQDVSGRMQPETVQLRSLSARSGFTVLEQGVDFALLTPQKLLERFVGRQVRVVRVHPQTGAESFEEATVLAVADGVVLRIGDRIETGVPGRLVFPEVPAGLRERPTFTALVRSGSDRPQELELSYLTGGLAWRADYVAELNPAEDRLDLSAWVTLTNQTGADFPAARVQLVAGTPNRVREAQPLRSRAAAPMLAEARMEADGRQETLSEYHLYTLERPVTLEDRQSRQVALLQADGVAVRKEYLLRGANHYYLGGYPDWEERQRVGVFLEFDNREDAGLGRPLPRGVVRVYQRDAAGHAQFLGEDAIPHTPEKEKVRLRLGEAFDLTGERRQTDFQRLPGVGKARNVFESAYRIVLRNAKKEEVIVKVQEPIPGDWEMLRESHPHRKEAANLAAWQIKVPAGGEVVLEYRVRVKN